MQTLSGLLIFVAALAAAGLLYEMAVEHRRATLRARSEREWQRLNVRPMARSQGEK